MAAQQRRHRHHRRPQPLRRHRHHPWLHSNGGTGTTDGRSSTDSTDCSGGSGSKDHADEPATGSQSTSRQSSADSRGGDEPAMSILSGGGSTKSSGVGQAATTVLNTLHAA